MPPPKLLRTKSFWLGLLAVAGMAWAWIDTAFSETCLTYAGSTEAYQVGRLDGATTFVTGPPGLIAARPGWEYLRGLNTSKREDWESLWTSVGARHFTLPDAAIFFPLLAAWLGWLAWRRKRRQLLELSLE